MKKIFFLAAYVAVITAFFSCSREQDQYFSQAVPHNAHTNSTLSENNSDENTVSKFGGGEDDDKPIIMHFVRNSESEPLQNAIVTMISNTDSLQSLTNSAGESLFELPYPGPWILKITLGGYLPVEANFTVTDSFSVRTSFLEHQ